MLLDLGFLLILAVMAAGLGDWILAGLRERPEHPGDAWGLAVTLGLGAIGLASLGLAMVGGLSPLGLGGLGLASLVAGGWRGLRVSVEAARAIRRVQRDGSWLGWLIDVAGVATLAGTLIAALAPVTDGDALCYHLQVPKVFLIAHSTTFEPDLHETIYPLLTEMLYAGALEARGPVACRLVQWLLGLAFACIVTALARPSLGSARARWAGTIALLVPAVSNGMTAPLNDVALATFGNAAILAWTRWRDRPTLCSATLSGIALGLALGVKYPALVLGGILAAGFVVGGPKGLSVGRRLGYATLFGLVALLVGGGWYWRAFEATGNPVFPFYRQVFGGSGIDEVLDPIKRPMAVTAFNVLTALGPMTLEPARFDSFSHQFGPVFWLFLPPLLMMRPPPIGLGGRACRVRFPDPLPHPAAKHAVRPDRRRADGGGCGLGGVSLGRSGPDLVVEPGFGGDPGGLPDLRDSPGRGSGTPGTAGGAGDGVGGVVPPASGTDV